jgi:Na+/H+ antiporter NhaD/arsenite permease-like protein
MSLLLRIAALVIFILVVIFVIVGMDWQVTTYLALLAGGLACWVGSTLVADTARVIR